MYWSLIIIRLPDKLITERRLFNLNVNDGQLGQSGRARSSKGEEKGKRRRGLLTGVDEVPGPIILTLSLTISMA